MKQMLLIVIIDKVVPSYSAKTKDRRRTLGDNTVLRFRGPINTG